MPHEETDTPKQTTNRLFEEKESSSNTSDHSILDLVAIRARRTIKGNEKFLIDYGSFYPFFKIFPLHKPENLSVVYCQYKLPHCSSTSDDHHNFMTAMNQFNLKLVSCFKYSFVSLQFLLDSKLCAIIISNNTPHIENLIKKRLVLHLRDVAVC